MTLAFKTVIASGLLVLSSYASAWAMDQQAEVRSILSTPYPQGLRLTEVVERFRHNANCSAYYSMRALERGNSIVDDGKYGPAVKRYYNANQELAAKYGYDKWQAAGYILARQKELAEAILASGFEPVLNNDKQGCSLKYRLPKPPRTTLEVIE